jgi:methyl-accepting chemotaxis protein
LWLTQPNRPTWASTWTFFAFDKKVISDVKAGRETSQYKVSKTTGNKTYYILAPIAIGSAKKKWSLAMNIPISKVLEQPRKVFYATLIVGNAALLVLLGVVYLISGGISRPVVEIAGVVNKVATDRDLTLQAPVKTGDEVGLMAKAFNNMIDVLRESLKLADNAATEVDSFSDEVSKRAIGQQGRVPPKKSARWVSSRRRWARWVLLPVKSPSSPTPSGTQPTCPTGGSRT